MIAAELIAEGQIFDMEPRASMRAYTPNPQLVVICGIQGYQILVAPLDSCCIPARLYRSSVETAIAAGELRPVSLIKRSA